MKFQKILEESIGKISCIYENDTKIKDTREIEIGAKRQNKIEMKEKFLVKKRRTKTKENYRIR